MFLFVIISLILFAFYTVLIAYYRKAWKAIPVYSPAPRPFTTKISVLVPARNEEGNIGTCLESLFRQSYPRELYQVIVIDDHSTDRTAETVREYAGGGPAGGNDRASEIGESDPGRERDPDGDDRTAFSVQCLSLATQEAGAIKAHKKFAIETGIRAATGDLIITTDADCWSGPDWLRTIAAFYEDTGAKFVAAPVRIGEGLEAAAGKPDVRPGIRGKGLAAQRKRSSFLSVFQTLDFITLQGITGAAVYRRFHSMCNGANLAYERAAFYEVDGFKGIDAIPSGDDMLLMHKIYLKYPGQVFFLKSPRAIVSTRPETSWKGFINQRVRWASKADHYDDRRIFWVLLLVYILNLLFIGLLVAAFWNSWYAWILLILLMIKTMVEYPFVRPVAAFFGQQRLMVYFPALQPFHIFYTIVIGWLGKFGSYRWKDRKINK